MKMGTQRTIKVVFLIDKNAGTHDESPFAAVRLAVLKLLTHFSCRDGRGTVNEKMRWGYRVFDSSKECQMYKKRAIWLQYSNKHFEDFEEHLKENVPPRSDGIRSKTREHHHDHHDCSSREAGSHRNSPPRLRVPCEGGPVGVAGSDAMLFCNNIGDECEDSEDASSAYAVRYALQDVMHDFQWEEPDMCSPMKSSRARSSRHRRKKKENSYSRVSASCRQSSSAISSLISDGRQKHRRKEKMIFLAMKCPPTMKSLEEFVGDATKLNSPLSLRDTIMTKEFLADFCGEQNGVVFWLNTSLVPPARPTYDLLSEMLGHMGGQVISLDWLMSCRSHVTSCLHSLQATQKALQQQAENKTGKMDVDGVEDEDDQSAKKIPVPRNLLPLSIIIDYFLRLNVGSELGVSEERSSMSRDSFQAKLCSYTGGSQSDHCMLRMMPMFTPKMDCILESSAPSSSETFVIRNTEESKAPTPRRKTTRNQSNNSSGQVSVNQSKAFSLETGDQTPSHVIATTATQEPSPPETHTLTIRAKIDRRRLELGAFDSSSTFSCIGYDFVNGRDDSESSRTKNAGHLSQWFREAMLELSHRNMSLIVELSSSASSMTALGVMEPLTPAMASVRLLHPKSILPLASAIAFQPCPGSVDQSFDATGQRVDKLKQFMEKSAKAILGSRKAGHYITGKLKRTEELSTLPVTDPRMIEELSHIETAHHEPFLSSWLEPWHISAPSRHTCDQVVEQLLSIPDDRHSPSLKARQDSNFDTLSKQLKNIFKAEKGSTEVTSPQSKAMPDEQSKNKLKDASVVRQSPRLKRMKSTPSYVGARTASIMANSRKLQASKPKVTATDKKSSMQTKKKSDPIPVKLPDVSSVEDLTKHLKQNYEDVLSQNSCSLRFTQSTVAVILHFFKTSSQTSDQEDSISNMRTFIADTLLLTNKQLRERYAERSNDLGMREVRVQEVEIQTLLRLEMESVEPSDITGVKAKEKEKKKDDEDKDDEDSDDEGISLPEALQDSVDEAVHMLESVPIFASADKLTALLNDVVLANYSETIPYMVRAIYEGLVKPVPLALVSPTSVATGVPSHKQPASYRSISSGGSHHALGSNSNRSRALVRHSSIADAAPKRIIGVPARRLPHEKKKPDAAEKKKKEQDNSAKKVKRNLFNDDSPDSSKLTRRRSVAVMETHAFRRSPRKVAGSSQLVLKTKVVKETPGKKQVLKAMLNKLDRARRRSSSKERGTPGPGAMLVIEESPEKPVGFIQPNVRRSPRVHTLKRRPSFYKKQEMHRGKLLAARIAGTSPPGVALTRQLSAKKADEKPKVKLSPATFLLSAITSPASKTLNSKESPAEAGFDSPSRNTRSKTGVTPVKVVMDSPGRSAVRTAITSPASKTLNLKESPAEAGFDSPSRNTRSMTGVTPVKVVMDSPGRSAVRTTPRAKARRRLNDELFKKEAQMTPTKDHSSISRTPSKSPSKAMIGVTSIGHWQSPRLLQKRGSGSKETDRRGAVAGPVESNVNSIQESVPARTSTRRTPKKALRKIAFKSIDGAGNLKDRGNTDLRGNQTTNPDATERTASNNHFDKEGRDEELESRTETNSAKVEEKMDDTSKSQGGEPLEITGMQGSWFDKLAEGFTDKERDMDQDHEPGHKRRRSTPCKEDHSTPPIKQRYARRDTCTPPYVPASKCTTPEVINSWPRRKTRYNSPSPCTSKVLSPCDISPIATIDEIIASLASPHTKIQTPQSSSKQKGTGSGRKRKRQSPGVHSSEKKLRRSSGSTRSSPKAKGSLLSMLTSKRNLEQRCISPVFGKAPCDLMTSEAPGSKAGTTVMRKNSGTQKKQQPARKCKSSPGTKDSGSSEESLDVLDRSFSPIFGKSIVTDPGASSQSDESSDTKQQESANAAKMSFIDQGLDSEADSDPEIDFPKLKSNEGSTGILSDSEMAMMMDKDAELGNEKEETNQPPSEGYLPRSPHENHHGEDSVGKKLLTRNSSHLSQSLHPADQQISPAHDRTVDKKHLSEEKSLSSNFGKSLRKRRSSEKQDSKCKLVQDAVFSDKTEVKGLKQELASSNPRLPDTKLLEDVENTRPKEPPKKRKKKVTMMTRIPSSLGRQRSTPSRLSMTLKRPSAGENWTVTNSPEPASLMGASEDFSLSASSLSSADDDVFERSSVAGPSPSNVASTPPTQSGKPSFATTPLSATGLYSLMNSPMVASGNRRSSMSTPKSGRTSRTSRRNLPLQ